MSTSPNQDNLTESPPLSNMEPSEIGKLPPQTAVSAPEQPATDFEMGEVGLTLCKERNEAYEMFPDLYNAQGRLRQRARPAAIQPRNNGEYSYNTAVTEFADHTIAEVVTYVATGGTTSKDIKELNAKDRGKQNFSKVHEESILKLANACATEKAISTISTNVRKFALGLVKNERNAFKAEVARLKQRIEELEEQAEEIDEVHIQANDMYDRLEDLHAAEIDKFRHDLDKKEDTIDEMVANGRIVEDEIRRLHHILRGAGVAYETDDYINGQFLPRQFRESEENDNVNDGHSTP